MPSINITQQTIARAKADAKPGAPQSEITDAKSQGLRLRIGARGVRWQLRFKVAGENVRLDLGEVDEWSVAEARDIASEAQRVIRGGIRKPDAKWVEEQRIRLGKIEAPVSHQADHKLSFKWDWERAKSEYIAEVQRSKKPATYNDYRRMLTTPELDRFAGRPVGSITLEEMAIAIRDIHRRGVERLAEHAASVVRPMFKFLSSADIRSQSGVERGIMTELTAPARSRKSEDLYGNAPGTYVPEPRELGRIVAICRSGAMHPLVSSAIELTIFGVQRRMQTVLMLKRKVEAISDNEALWFITAAQRKTAERRGDRSDHVVPLSAPAYTAVKRAIDWCDDHKSERINRSPRVFPQFRPRRKGGVVDHMSVDSVSHNFSYMPAVFATPHDVRRAFGTHGETLLGFSPADTKAILDHLEGHQSGDVTRTSYALHNGTHFKWPLMRTWANWIEEQVVDAIETDPRLLDVEWLKGEMKKAQDIAKGLRKKGVSLAKVKKTAIETE